MSIVIAICRRGILTLWGDCHLPSTNSFRRKRKYTRLKSRLARIFLQLIKYFSIGRQFYEFLRLHIFRSTSLPAPATHSVLDCLVYLLCCYFFSSYLLGARLESQWSDASNREIWRIYICSSNINEQRPDDRCAYGTSLWNYLLFPP